MFSFRLLDGLVLGDVPPIGSGHPGACPWGACPAAAMGGSQALNLLDSQLETTHHYTCRPSPHKDMNLKPKTHSGGV